MDVCFIARGGREAFLGARIPRRPGRVVDLEGVTVATHDGVDAFTIGQRRGLGVVAGARRYVVEISASDAVITVGPPDALLRDRVRVPDLQLARTPPARVLVQTRAHGRVAPARIAGDEIVFDTPQPRVAPGQVVACYDGDICCGGGVAAA